MRAPSNFASMRPRPGRSPAVSRSRCRSATHSRTRAPSPSLSVPTTIPGNSSSTPSSATPPTSAAETATVPGLWPWTVRAALMSAAIPCPSSRICPSRGFKPRAAVPTAMASWPSSMRMAQASITSPTLAEKTSTPSLPSRSTRRTTLISRAIPPRPIFRSRPARFRGRSRAATARAMSCIAPTPSSRS